MAFLLTLLIFRREILNAEQKGLASDALQFITGSPECIQLLYASHNYANRYALKF